jgi:hypothetical protein
MNRYPGIPEMLELFMAEEGCRERWVTVRELRDRFGLTRYQGNTVSGFLRRLRYRSFGQCPCIVIRIEHDTGDDPLAPQKSRYLVRYQGGCGGRVQLPPHPNHQAPIKCSGEQEALSSESD